MTTTKSSTPSGDGMPSLDADAIQILRAVLEEASLSHKQEIELAPKALLLRALLRDEKLGGLPKVLEALTQIGYLKSWRQTDTRYAIELPDRIKIPSLQDDVRDGLRGNILKRAILFHLYGLYKKHNHLKVAMAPLVPLADVLGVGSDALKLAAQELIDGYCLEYAVMDGGQYTCHLTESGARTARLIDTLIQEFPGVEMDSILKAEAPTKKEIATDPKKVFVVHGRNEGARKALFIFLRSIGLEPLEWSEGVKLTGNASPYIGEVLDAMFQQAQAVVVLITGDDYAMLDRRLLASGEPPEQLTPQARPNVLFEAGMAFASHQQRTVMVELGRTRPFSDVAGRLAIKLEDSVAKRQELAERLKTAGCPVQIEGRTDWHTAGQFEAATLSGITHGDTPDVGAEVAFNQEVLKRLADAYSVFNIDQTNSIPAYLRKLGDARHAETGVYVYEQWYFLARQNGGLSASAEALVTQVQGILNSATRAIRESAALRSSGTAAGVYGELVPRYNEFAADLERYLRQTTAIHNRPPELPRLQATLLSA